MKKKLLPVLACLLAALLLFSGCSSHGKTFIKAGDEEISIHVFQLYLSRLKGELASAGVKVNDQTYWDGVIDLETQMRRSEFFTNQVYEGLKQIAAALILYKEEGLKLSSETEQAIDDWIDALIEEVGEGSKNKLNSILAEYGANITVLRDAAIIEAKLEQLKTHLYGEDGSLIASTVKEEFYQNTYYRGYQMLIANYYHDHDRNPDDYDRPIYYVTDSEGNLKKNIAYDTKNGTMDVDAESNPIKDANGDTVYRTFGEIAYDTKKGTVAYDKDEDGNQVKRRDAQGNVVYVLENGDVAYDTKNGKPATVTRELEGGGTETVPETDDKGNQVYRKWVIAYDKEKGALNYHYNSKGENDIAYYSTEEMEKRLLLAEQIAEDCRGNQALFLEYMKEFSDNSAFNEAYAPNGMYFSEGTYATDTIFYTFSTELADLEVGEMAVLNSDSGYYIIMRADLDEGAWNVEENSRWFGTMSGLVQEYMLQQLVAEKGYLDLLEIKEELMENVDITTVAANSYY